MTTLFREGIHRVENRPAELVPMRCSGCGWASSNLGPQIVFVGFSQELFRGVIIDSAGAGALLERLDELVLCSECVARCAFLIDPAPARSARQKSSEEQKRLQEEIAAHTLEHKRVRLEIVEGERRLEELRKARDKAAELRAKAARWGSSYDQAARAFRDASLKSWATERAQEGDGSPEAAAELAQAKEQLDKARVALRALTTAGGRLGGQCMDKGLSFEHGFIRDRLAGGPDDE